MTSYRVRKGNRAERAVREALQRQGYTVRDGPHTESGCDLYVFHADRTLYTEAEVKGRKETTVNGLLTDEKRAIARRAKECRAIDWPYRLYFVRFEGAALPSHAEVYTVGTLVASSKRKGLHLETYKEGLLSLTGPQGPPLRGGGEPPMALAEVDPDDGD